MHPIPFSRRRFLALSSAAAASGFLSQLGANACPVLDKNEPMADPKELAKAINHFALDLQKELDRDDKKSTFFSPYSIETALAMTSGGARGETLAEMEKTLHLPKDPHAMFGQMILQLDGKAASKPRGYELTTANAIWAMKGFPWRKEFVELASKNYGAGLVETDFSKPEEARTRINTWVEKETKDRIKELIPLGVLDALTRMVLTNAIYFKGTWQHTFDKKMTNDAPFIRADNSTATVPMMSQKARFNYGKQTLGDQSGLEVQVLELPYSGKELSMLVYLPQKDRGIDQMVTRLNEGAFSDPILTPSEVKVFLPRFKVEAEYSLKPALMKLGMKKAFADADFQGLHSSDEKLRITHVLHKAFVEVNEEGTEAAAATAVVVGRTPSPPDRTPVFRADRPFVFVIRDNKTGAALFIGKYAGPVK